MDSDQFSALMDKMDLILNALKAKGAKNTTLLGARVKTVHNWNFHEKRKAIKQGDELTVVNIHTDKGSSYYDLMDKDGKIYPCFGSDDFTVVT